MGKECKKIGAAVKEEASEKQEARDAAPKSKSNELQAEKKREKAARTAKSKERQYHFISGLPRSGSTLLCNILAQNPEFHATATSGLCDPIVQLRNTWDNIFAFRAMDRELSETRKKNTLRGMFFGFFKDVEERAVFDKSRGWTGFPELLEMILEARPKIIVTVRDLREVFASFEKLWRKTIATRQPSQEAENIFAAQTAIGRVQLFAGPGGLVGLPVNRIKDMATRGYRDSMHIVEYEDLCRSPEKTLTRIYEFLDCEPFEHDFENVEQVTYEDDYVNIFPDLHKIRPRVEAQAIAYPQVYDDTVQDHPLWKEVTKKEERLFWRFLR